MIKTVEVKRYAIRLGDEIKSPEVRRAAEVLAETILAYQYPMIPNKKYVHKWADAGLISTVDCPSVIQYIEPEEDELI